MGGQRRQHMNHVSGANKLPSTEGCRKTDGMTPEAKAKANRDMVKDGITLSKEDQNILAEHEKFGLFPRK